MGGFFRWSGLVVFGTVVIAVSLYTVSRLMPIPAEDAEALASNSKMILPLQTVLGLDEQTRANAKARLGVLLMPGDPVEQIADLLGDLSLVALSFPAFSDGRSFSKAQLLRGRHGYHPRP